jgi:hypothetical protein
MSEGIWTVEGPFFHDQQPTVPAYCDWAVMDEDGDRIEWFDTQAEAEAWLEDQQAAAEQAARGER